MYSNTGFTDASSEENPTDGERLFKRFLSLCAVGLALIVFNNAVDKYVWGGGLLFFGECVLFCLAVKTLSSKETDVVTKAFDEMDNKTFYRIQRDTQKQTENEKQ